MDKTYRTYRTYRSYPEGGHTMNDDAERPLIRPHGGYRGLKAYEMTEIVYDCTTHFVARCMDKRSRTTDQMIQAARSGKQNIAEGSAA